VVDELVQIHGGYGYIEEYPAAAFYRDARIHRIWEGTNEINRLLVPGTLLKRAMTGRLELLGPAQRATDALLGGEQPTFTGELADQAAAVAATRTVTLLLAGAALQRFGAALEEQQEILAGLADLAIDLFAMESVLERATQAATDDPQRSAIHADLARLVIAERSGAVEQRAKWLSASLAEGDEARTLQAGVRRLLRGEPLDHVALLRRVAASVIADRGYPV
jgi:alkylation response protein AidB-like acyl-CoA dehydrogenase